VELHYYNEFDPHAAQWLRNLMDADLIPRGEVDERSISDVSATELRGYAQCHFFAGISGWEEALRLAGWDSSRPVWSGSCPCQSFSSAGKRKGKKDERHLWPEFFRLIRECRPVTVFGEQVASSGVVGSQLEAAFYAAVQAGDNRRANHLAEQIAERESEWNIETDNLESRWIDGVCADLQSEGYAVWYAILGAHSVGAPHIRQRLFWVAESNCERFDERENTTIATGSGFTVQTEADGDDGGLVNADIRGRETGRLTTEATRHRGSVESAGGSGGLGHATSNGRDERRAESERRQSAERCERGGLGDTGSTGSQERSSERRVQPGAGHPPAWEAAELSSHWNDYEFIPCRDGKTRRSQSRLQPLVAGLPFLLADGRTRQGVSRAKVLKGIGNAIVPQVAAVFIRAFMESQDA
jgi:DNA (cytosine-5)-methyltransferase 1